MTVKQEFDSGTIGWEVLFIFIAGMIGDMFVHLMGDLTHKKMGTKGGLLNRLGFPPFAQGLLEYYKSLGEKLLIFDTSNWTPKHKAISGWFQGAIWGGIACAVALLIAKLFLYAKEETEIVKEK
jgi:hypothetical protein